MVNGKEKTKRQKDVVYSILQECSLLQTDEFWKRLFDDLSRGKCPKGILIYNGVISSTSKRNGFTYNINEKTGALTMNPDSVGVFISAIKVEEFRNNKKIGETRLEYELYVADSLKSTSTKENQPFNSSIKVYPNPFQNNLVLEILAYHSSQIKLRIIDFKKVCGLRRNGDPICWGEGERWRRISER